MIQKKQEQGNVVETITVTGEELQNPKITDNNTVPNGIRGIVILNAIYTAGRLQAKVKQGETIEPQVAVTYSLKEPVTLKMPAELHQE